MLDFGLAKAMEPPGALSSSVSQAPTITTPAMMTGVGMILGTAAYMAPEQACGKAVDKRADIWAFGAVLFEMPTGQRAFGGEDVAETLATSSTRNPPGRDCRRRFRPMSARRSACACGRHHASASRISAL